METFYIVQNTDNLGWYVMTDSEFYDERFETLSAAKQWLRSICIVSDCY